jgi:hypothetical protein
MWAPLMWSLARLNQNEITVWRDFVAPSHEEPVWSVRSDKILNHRRPTCKGKRGKAWVYFWLCNWRRRTMCDLECGPDSRIPHFRTRRNMIQSNEEGATMRFTGGGVLNPNFDQESADSTHTHPFCVGQISSKDTSFRQKELIVLKLSSKSVSWCVVVTRWSPPAQRAIVFALC